MKNYFNNLAYASSVLLNATIPGAVRGEMLSSRTNDRIYKR